MKNLNEENIPSHRTAPLVWEGEAEARKRLLKTAYCGVCEKIGLPTFDAARSYLGLIMSTPGRRARPEDFAMTPYACPHNKGMWHVGRNYKTAALLRREI